MPTNWAAWNFPGKPCPACGFEGALLFRQTCDMCSGSLIHCPKCGQIQCWGSKMSGFADGRELATKLKKVPKWLKNWVGRERVIDVLDVAKPTSKGDVTWTLRLACGHVKIVTVKSTVTASAKTYWCDKCAADRRCRYMGDPVRSLVP